MKKKLLCIIIIILIIFGVNKVNSDNDNISKEKKMEENVESKKVNFDENKYIEILQKNGYTITYFPNQANEAEKVLKFHIATKNNVRITYKEFLVENTKKDAIYDANEVDENIIKLDIEEEDRKNRDFLDSNYLACKMDLKIDGSNNAVEKKGENWSQYIVETRYSYANAIMIDNMIISIKTEYINSKEEVQKSKTEIQNILNSFFEEE